MTERDTAFGRVNIPDPPLFPDVMWSDFITHYLESTSRLLGVLGNTRRGHREPPTAAEVEEFEQWKRDYERLTEDGYATGWLHQGYEPDEVGGPRGVWVWDETEAEYAARRAAEQPPANDRVTIPVLWGTTSVKGIVP